jgi:hypothetical protein
VAIGQHESNLKAVMDQNVELREQQEKNNGLSEKFINEWKMSVVSVTSCRQKRRRLAAKSPKS